MALNMKKSWCLHLWMLQRFKHRAIEVFCDCIGSVSDDDELSCIVRRRWIWISFLNFNYLRSFFPSKNPNQQNKLIYKWHISTNRRIQVLFRLKKNDFFGFSTFEKQKKCVFGILLILRRYSHVIHSHT